VRSATGPSAPILNFQCLSEAVRKCERNRGSEKDKLKGINSVAPNRTRVERGDNDDVVAHDCG